MTQIQEEINDLQKRLETMTFFGTSYQGKIRVWANGLQLIINLDINPELLTTLSPHELNEGIIRACNSALKQARDCLSEEIGRVTGGGLEWPNLTEGRY
ncbi:MAG: YbaB/EbfC family nucleoid-associated protein [Firmicutes bacterium]|nr:YbaB/EbfC family nucleoid-associated protein [Bacillota bacterium]